MQRRSTSEHFFRLGRRTILGGFERTPHGPDTHTRARAHTHTHARTHTHTHTHTHAHICVHARACVCAHVCVFAHACVLESVHEKSVSTVKLQIFVRYLFSYFRLEPAFLPYPEPPPMIDLDITGAHIMSVARWLRGGAGPGGSDSTAWQYWLLRYGAHSERLRDAVARLTRAVANGSMPWQVLRALLSNRLIALDKCPGVRPIGIGECLRRVMAKAVMMVAGGDVREVCGSDQLCSGLEAGIEAAIHALCDLFDEHKGTGWGVLLVDASNAFNSLNRKAALWNARHQFHSGNNFSKKLGHISEERNTTLRQGLLCR